MRGDVETLSIASTILVAALLLWRFRSPWVLGVIAVPVVLGIAAAALVVQIAFGFVHGVAVGFGMTMLGVTVDYPVLLVGHRKQGEAAPATLRRIGQAFTLSVITAALGLTGMLFSGFPGLSQLGCFSIIGILVAASVTRWVLPRLIVAADLAPVEAGDPASLLRIERLRAWRTWGLGACVVAGATLLVMGGPRWEHELAALSPVPRAALALDAELRGELGAPDAMSIALVREANAEAVLRKQETLLPVLDALVAEGVLGGVEIAARYLPSAATQLARRDGLPAPDVLATRVAGEPGGAAVPHRRFPAVHRRRGRQPDDVAAASVRYHRRADRRAPATAAVPARLRLVRRDRTVGASPAGAFRHRDAGGRRDLCRCHRRGERDRRRVHRHRLALARARRPGGPGRDRGGTARAAARGPCGGSDRRRGADDGCRPHRGGRAAVADPYRIAAVRRRSGPGLCAVLRPPAA